MKKKNQLIGIVLFILGCGLAYWGYSESSSYGGQLTKALSGSVSDKAIMLYIGAAASVAAGLFLLTKKK